MTGKDEMLPNPLGAVRPPKARRTEHPSAAEPEEADPQVQVAAKGGPRGRGGKAVNPSTGSSAGKVGPGMVRRSYYARGSVIGEFDGVLNTLYHEAMGQFDKHEVLAAALLYAAKHAEDVRRYLASGRYQRDINALPGAGPDGKDA